MQSSAEYLEHSYKNTTCPLNLNICVLRCSGAYGVTNFFEVWHFKQVEKNIIESNSKKKNQFFCSIIH